MHPQPPVTLTKLKMLLNTVRRRLHRVVVLLLDVLDWAGPVFWVRVVARADLHKSRRKDLDLVLRPLLEPRALVLNVRRLREEASEEVVGEACTDTRGDEGKVERALDADADFENTHVVEDWSSARAIHGDSHPAKLMPTPTR